MIANIVLGIIIVSTFSASGIGRSMRAEFLKNLQMVLQPGIVALFLMYMSDGSQFYDLRARQNSTK